MYEDNKEELENLREQYSETAARTNNYKNQVLNRVDQIYQLNGKI